MTRCTPDASALQRRNRVFRQLDTIIAGLLKPIGLDAVRNGADGKRADGAT
jgi:hypothetical protein